VSKLENLPHSAQAILVVDDEPDILSALADLFEVTMPEAKVLTATSGEEGLKVLEAEKVDIIISDYKMPGMDGLEFLRRAQQRWPEVPRILITAYPQLNLAMDAINEAAIQNFFTKPLNPIQVQEAVKAALIKARMSQQRLQRFQDRQKPIRGPE